MGIDSNLVYQLASTAKAFDLHGRLCTLGVQTTPPQAVVDRALLAAGLGESNGRADLYARLGFDEVESVDVSDFEGCTHTFDLNTPGVPLHLRQRFDAVYNGGTLEHVFDLRAALRNVFELMKVGGVVIHAAPANGWLDHGFYQFSPTLLVDYYVANSFEILEAHLVHRVSDENGAVVVHSYFPGAFDARPGDAFPGRWLSYMVFRKHIDSTWNVVPQQRYYAAIYGEGADVAAEPELRYAPPYRMQDGVPVRHDAPRRTLPTPTHAEGFEWVAHIPELKGLADRSDRSTSPLVLFEDGRPIGPPHAIHSAIRTCGRGRYSHWGEWLRFSPASNDDASRHVYSYALWDAPDGEELS
jgi:hypothetical protein